MSSSPIIQPKPAAAAASASAVLETPQKKASEASHEDDLQRLSSPPLNQLLDDLSLKNSASAVVFRIVLTGGPCGGKTTALGTLTERFQALGWRVFRVPEAATMLLSGGHSFANMNKLQQYLFQGTLLRLMLSCEDAFINLARATHERCIVLCDRGTMDCRSYMPEEEWEQLTKEVGMSTMQLRDERYDCVLHLTTAANGAEEYYTTEGHAARSEPPAYARELDERIKNNWVGHPHFSIIDNSTDFRGKIRRIMSTICQFVGVNGNIGMSKRKFLVKSSSIQKINEDDPVKGDRIVFPEHIRYQRFEVDHDYILRPNQDKGHQLRLRRRGLNGQYTYSYTLRYPDLHGQRVELKRLVNRREYFDLLLQKDPATQTVTKKRYSFLYQNQYYELDQFITPHKGLYLLEFYAEKERDVQGMLPDFFQFEREVTDEKQFGMYYLAKKEHPATGPAPTNKRTMSVNAESDFFKNAQRAVLASLASGESLSASAASSTNLPHPFASAPTSPQIKPAAALVPPAIE